PCSLWLIFTPFAATSPESRKRISEIEGKAARVAARERGKRTSFKIVCCNFCKGLFLKAGLRWVDRNTDIRNQKSDIEHQFMPSLIRKLFHKSEAPKDGLTQPQREAIVDLLNYCMYADNLIFLAEDRVITDTVAKFNWDPKVPFDQCDVRSIDNARNAT